MPSFGVLPNVTSLDPLGSDREVIPDLGWLIGWVGFSTAGTFPVSRALCFGSVTLRDETSKGLALLSCPGLKLIRLLHLVDELHAWAT